MPPHKRVPTLLSTSLKRIEQLTADLVLNASINIATKACAVKEMDHEDIIEQTRNITKRNVDEIREVIFGHVVLTLHQDASLHILKE